MGSHHMKSWSVKHIQNPNKPTLIASFNPFEVILVKLDQFPQVGVKIKNMLKKPPTSNKPTLKIAI